MKTTRTWQALLGTMAALAFVVALGCSEGTSRKDVADARDKLQKEQQQTTETVREARRDVADAQNDARTHTTAKPVTTDTPTRDQGRVADAQVDAAQEIAKQKEREHAAAANVKDKEQQFQSTQARDAYVTQVESKLADTDTQIDTLKEKSSNATAADKDAINRQVDMLKTQRDLAEKALKDLKSADIATWKNHQEHVRVALQDLDNSVRNIR